MTKDDLIYDWRRKDFHPARQIVPFLLVAFAFVLCFGFFRIRFEIPDDVSVKSVSATYFLDDDLGRAWQLEAEEEGPFPGRLEIADYSGLLNSGKVTGLQREDLWRSQTISLKRLPAEQESTGGQIAAKGLRYFPSRSDGARPLQKTDGPAGVFELFPVLIPFEDEAEKWIPSELPPFRVKIEENTRTSNWRFILELRADGSVVHCFSLSGGREASHDEMVEYLERVRFEKSEEKSRWIGLRVEFLSRKIDESDAR